ncbi:MAG: S1/P1 nuclease [Steroidobacteraceae bacterium]
MKGLIAAVIAGALLSSPTAAWAWGAEGHRIVALIAADGLTPAAHAEVADLLGPDARTAMEAASTWADEIRPERPQTERWHFVDIELSAQGYVAERDCPAGDCVVAQIEKDERILTNVRFGKRRRAEALRFLIHFVGDIHQPLHCADDHDAGGNEVRVILGGEDSNLHEVWDTTLVAALGKDPAAVATALEARITPRERRAWSRGGAADWANESFAIAKRDIYGPLRGALRSTAPIRLPDDYEIRERPLVATQLEKAGVRLAMVLNEVLSRPPKTAALPFGAGTSVGTDGTRLRVAAAQGGATGFDTASPAVVTAADAASYVGRTVTVQGVVSDVHTTGSGVTFIDLGGRYPRNAFTAVIFAENAAAFSDTAALSGNVVEITGRVRLYRGKPEIILRSESQLRSERAH